MLIQIMQLPYCEQGFAIWNIFSSFAYFIAGFSILKLVLKEDRQNNLYLILTLLFWMIGIGSILYHSVLTVPALLLDAVPVYILLSVLIFLLQQQVGTHGNAPWKVTGIIVGIEGITTVVLPRLNSIDFNITIGIALGLVLAGGSYIIKQIYSSYPKILIVGVLLYSIGALSRVFEKGVCEIIPMGTHFIWHLCAAAAFYIFARVVIQRNVSYGSFIQRSDS